MRASNSLVGDDFKQERGKVTLAKLWQDSNLPETIRIYIFRLINKVTKTVQLGPTVVAS